MRKPVQSVFIASLFLFSGAAWGQSGNACDLNQDGKVDAADVQTAINGTLGLSSCTANVFGAGVCNVVVVQRVVNASLGGTCLTGTGAVAHNASLNWTASTSSNLTGYKVYRGTTSGGPYTLVTTLGLVTGYTDTAVQAGQIYYYVMTAVASTGMESAYSNQTQATIPTP
jgi:hypothetical protein